MSFISFAFAVFFFVFSMLYYTIPRFFLTEKNARLVQKILLLAASFFFYAFADLRFIPFLVYIIMLLYFTKYLYGGGA